MAKNDKKATPPKAPTKPAPKEDTDTEGKTQIRPDVTKYVAGVSGSGKKTLNNGDMVATALNGLSLDQVVEVAEALIPEADDLATRYKALNVGQQRMNLGNRIRGVVAKLEKANPGSGEIALNKAVKPFNKLRAEAPAVKAKPQVKAA
jgi:hypothetical protein